VGPKLGGSKGSLYHPDFGTNLVSGMHHIAVNKIFPRAVVAAKDQESAKIITGPLSA
jgi:hypothetical protein